MSSTVRFSEPESSQPGAQSMPSSGTTDHSQRSSSPIREIASAYTVFDLEDEVETCSCCRAQLADSKYFLNCACIFCEECADSSDSSRGEIWCILHSVTTTNPKKLLASKCDICVEEHGQDPKVFLACGHIFHTECIGKWEFTYYATAIGDQSSFPCPHCRDSSCDTWPYKPTYRPKEKQLKGVRPHSNRVEKRRSSPNSTRKTTRPLSVMSFLLAVVQEAEEFALSLQAEPVTRIPAEDVTEA